MDQTGELLPWIGGPTGPPPEVPSLDRGPATQVAPNKAQRVLPGLA